MFVEKLVKYLRYLPHKSEGKHREIVKRISERLKTDFKDFDLFVEETEFSYWRKQDTDGEFDNLILTHINGHAYFLIFEAKTSNKKENRKKAFKQLKKEKRLIKKLYPNSRVFCFFVYPQKEKFIFKRVDTDF